MSFSHVSTTIDKFADVETDDFSIAATVVAGDAVLLDVTRRKTGGITLGSVQFNGVALTQVGTDIDQGEVICSVYHGIAASSGTFNFTGTFSAFVYAIAAAIVMRPSSGGAVTVTNQNQNYLTGTFTAPSLGTTMASGDAVVSVLSGLGWDQSFNNVSASTWSATSPLTAQANGQNTGYLGVNRKYVATDVSSTGSVTQAWTVSAGQPQYNHNAIKLVLGGASATVNSYPATVRSGDTGVAYTTTGLTSVTDIDIGTLAATSVSDTSGDGTHSVPALSDGVAHELYGTKTVTITGTEGAPTTSTSFQPVTGNSFVTLSGTLNTTETGGLYNFSPAAVVTDQIVFPDTIAYDAQGNITGEAGSYSCWHIQASTKTARSYTVILGEPSGDVAPVMPADASVGADVGAITLGTYAATSGTAPITYSLSGTDAALFAINSSTGAVTFIAPATIGVYNITVTATNGAGADSQNLTITVSAITPPSSPPSIDKRFIMELIAPNAKASQALGYQQITDLSAAVGLTVPKGTTYILFKPNAQAIRFRDDGTNPTASVGYPVAAGAEYIYTGSSPSALRFIQASASATLDVLYYGVA